MLRWCNILWMKIYLTWHDPNFASYQGATMESGEDVTLIPRHILLHQAMHSHSLLRLTSQEQPRTKTEETLCYNPAAISQRLGNLRIANWLQEHSRKKATMQWANDYKCVYTLVDFLVLLDEELIYFAWNTEHKINIRACQQTWHDLYTVVVPHRSTLHTFQIVV